MFKFHCVNFFCYFCFESLSQQGLFLRRLSPALGSSRGFFIFIPQLKYLIPSIIPSIPINLTLGILWQIKSQTGKLNTHLIAALYLFGKRLGVFILQINVSFN
jgi:hypothetical protein